MHAIAASVVEALEPFQRSRPVELVLAGGGVAVMENFQSLTLHGLPGKDLRSRTGQEQPVASFVLDTERGAAFVERLREFLAYVLPQYDREGKAYVTVGIGCTGGRHRSVAIAESLANWLVAQGREVNLVHRDVERVP